MVGVIVLFPKLENGKYIKNILVRNGIEVTAVHTSGSQAILTTENMEEGLIVCGYRYRDMRFDDLREYLPEDFETLVLLSKTHWEECSADNAIKLAMPVKAFELVQAANALLEKLEQRRRIRKAKPKARSAKAQRTIRRAKEVLMEHHGMTEEEAHRYLQKRSMDTGTNLVEMAGMVLAMYLDGKDE